MIEAFFSSPYSILGAILLASFAGYIAWRNGHKARIAVAAATFRAAIDPTVFYSFNGSVALHGHVLHAALIQTFPAHMAAAHEFRRYLNPIERWRFSRAWKAYHGGSEEHPDWFMRYCLPNNGTQLLTQRLEALRDVANQT